MAEWIVLCAGAALIGLAAPVRRPAWAVAAIFFGMLAVAAASWAIGFEAAGGRTAAAVCVRL